MPLFWATVFAVVLFPFFSYLRKKFGGRGIPAALVTILFTLIVIFAPLYIIGTMIANEAIDMYIILSESDFKISPVSLENIPIITPLIETFVGDPQLLVERTADIIRGATTWFASQAVSIGTNTLGFTLKFALMMYVLFFLLKDGERLAYYIMRIIPLGDMKERLLFTRFSSTTRAIIKGSVIVSIVQGLIGAILFLIAGVPSPTLWGVMMALLALIPAIGPGLVWAPVGIYFLITGSVWQGAIILIGGGVVISLIDNILRPILVGRDTEMPDALILLAILGGIASFGITGVIIGPVIAALFLSTWNLFAHEYEKDLDERG